MPGLQHLPTDRQWQVTARSICSPVMHTRCTDAAYHGSDSVSCDLLWICRTACCTTNSQLIEVVESDTIELNHTGTVFATFGCSRASLIKQTTMYSLCDPSVVQVGYCTVCSGISSYCVLGYPLQQCSILYVDHGAAGIR